MNAELELRSLIAACREHLGHAEYNPHKHKHSVTASAWSALMKQVKLTEQALAKEEARRAHEAAKGAGK